MTPSLDRLAAEHDALRVAMVILARQTAHVQAGLPFPREDCAHLLRFLQAFVVGVHFHKESDLLLPRLAMQGDPTAAALAGVLLRLQEEFESLLQALVVFWEPRGELTPSERQGFASAASALQSLSRRMLASEERGLFPRIARLPGDDRLEWARACGDLERERSVLAQWQPSLDELSHRWN